MTREQKCVLKLRYQYDSPVSEHILFSLRSDLRSCYPCHSVDVWAERFAPIFLLHDEHFISDRDVSMSSDSVPMFICVFIFQEKYILNVVNVTF